MLKVTGVVGTGLSRWRASHVPCAAPSFRAGPGATRAPRSSSAHLHCPGWFHLLTSPPDGTSPPSGGLIFAIFLPFAGSGCERLQNVVELS